jgi:hypothetical protein
LIEILLLGLRKVLGSLEANKITLDIMPGYLQAAYEAEHFRQTRLYSSIQHWEETNKPFKVWKQV